MGFHLPHPKFNQINIGLIDEDVKSLTSENKEKLENQLDNLKEYSWEALVAPIEEREDALNKFWSPISHLNSVSSSPELREKHDLALQSLSAYYTQFGQNKKLYDAYKKLKVSDSFATLSIAQQTVINHSLRDFELSGIDLPDEKRQRFAEIKARLAKLSSSFSNNVLDATQAWFFFDT